MTSISEQTPTANPKWWKRQTPVQRAVTVIAGLAVLLCVGSAAVIGGVLLTSGSSNVTSTSTAKPPGVLLPASNVTTVVTQAKNQDVCLSPRCIDSALSVKKKMNSSVNPCDNFYEFACGGFLNSAIIPANKGSLGTFSLVRDNVNKQLTKSLASESGPEKRKPFKLAKNLYNSCMNTTAIEEKGLEPLRNVLKTLGGWPVLDGDQWDEDGFDWRTTMYKFRDAGYHSRYFVDFNVGVDRKNSSRSVIKLREAPLGLSGEYLKKGFDNDLVQAYYKYMMDIAVLLGANKDRAEIELKESLQFETNIALISLEKKHRRNATHRYNPMTIKKLSRKYPAVPWKEYLTTLMPPTISIEDNEIVIVSKPTYIAKLIKLMSITPKRVHANYAMWRAAKSSIINLNEEAREIKLEYSKILNGIDERSPRSKECMSIVSRDLPLSVGAMYVRKYFNKQAKQNATEMVADIRKQFYKILDEVEWMDEETRRSALEKAKSMSAHIAYPDELFDDLKLEEFYEKLELSPDNYFENHLNLTRFAEQNMFDQLRKPVNKSDWIRHGKSAVVNAHYTATENSMEIPAGILQDAFFANDRPRYMNYGAIGFIIGHEMTHGFDDKGSQFDKNGNLVDWWAPATKQQYLQRARCIIDQYQKYTVEINGTTINLKGMSTQGENIADNGGIKEAYRAYNDWVERNEPEQKMPGLDYTPRQMFWISAATTWCTKYRPETLKNRITTNSHSPSEFRILGTFSNTPEFAKDFNCPVGSKMNPVKKCSMW